jgi:phage shock protein C
MYCTACGRELQEGSKYCSQCGASVGPQPAPPATRDRLVRVRSEKKIAGVCAGFARYLGVDVTLVRIVWLVLTLAGAGVGLIAYIVAWIVMPWDDRVAASSPNGDRYPVTQGQDARNPEVL